MKRRRSVALGNWLAGNFPYLFARASPHDLTNKSNKYVASVFLTLFNAQGQKTYAQLMAAGLATYAASASLSGGIYARPFGDSWLENCSRILAAGWRGVRQACKRMVMRI